MIKFRDLVFEHHDNRTGVLAYLFREDQHYAIIPVSSAFIVDGEDGINPMAPNCLITSWYKSRGRTESMMVFNEDKNEARPPSKVEFDKIFKYLKTLIKKTS